jgi:hypothetical protein
MPSTARDAADTYHQSVNTKDLMLLRTIFADDATLAVPVAITPGNPTGTFHGIDDVMGFFERVSFPDKAILTYTHVYETHDTCVVELVGELPDRTVEAVDIFTVGGDGLVIRMAVYARVT